ncbi:MAG TPA: YihY/virulence factor BrkB family protein [Nocardioidaceae bacterium]|nr:YihY/virulence factor BrkB family protein [Nocardioidaceae bacterium]
MSGDAGSRRASETSRWALARDSTWRLLVSTVGTCYRNRVTGLAAEAAFFALLSLPPLIFALVGSIGYVFESFSDARSAEIRGAVVEASTQIFTQDTVTSIVEPTLNDVFRGGRYDVISIGFVLALWSGSRALNVFVETITIMYGLGGQRGIVKTRMLSFVLYVLGLVTGIVTIPLVLAGPTLVERIVPDQFGFVNALYWPAVAVLSITFLATLYHVSVPVRTSWRYNLPGATLTLVFWVLGSFLLRWVLSTTAGESTSIYGPLAAPIAVLLWLYLLSIAVLIGAAVNAAFDRVWPESETARARMELVRRLRLTAMLPRLRRDREEHRRFAPVGEELEESDETADHDAAIRALEELEELEEEADGEAHEGDPGRGATKHG